MSKFNKTAYKDAIGIDAFEKQKSRKDCKVVYGEFYFTRVGKPITQLNTKKDGLIDVDPHFKANVALSEASAKYFRDQGFNVREAGAGIPKPHLSIKRNVKDRTTKIDIFDKDGNEMDPSILIGNGSKGQALMFVYELPDGSKNGALLGIQINELVKYEAAEKPEYGATAKPTATPVRKKASYGAAKPTESPTPQEDLDDDLPF